MQTIRTTITIPKHIHSDLKRKALEEDKSLNDLLLERITKEETVDVKKSLERLEKLTKGIKIKASEYKEFINYGRKY